MEIDLNSVEFKFNYDAEGVEEIKQNIRTIFTTPVGTVAFDRDFGIDWGILDQPLPRAKAMLTVEYIEKVRRYEPRAKVDEVQFINNSDIGALIPKVVIDIVQN